MSIVGEYICSICGSKFYEDHEDGVCVPTHTECARCRLDSRHVSDIIISKLVITDNGGLRDE